MNDSLFHPMHRLNNEARQMKDEAELNKQRASTLEAQQKLISQDIAEMQSANSSVNALIADYVKNEPILKAARSDLSSFASSELKILRERYKEDVDRIEKVRTEVTRELGNKRKAVEEQTLKLTNAKETAQKKQDALATAKKNFDAAKAEVKDLTANQEELKKVRDTAAASDDVNEKYIGPLQIEERLKMKTWPEVNVLESNLKTALAALQGAIAENYEATRHQMSMQNEMDRVGKAFDSLEKDQFTLLRAAKKELPPPE